MEWLNSQSDAPLADESNENRITREFRTRMSYTLPVIHNEFYFKKSFEVSHD